MLRLDRSFCSDTLMNTVLHLESALGRHVVLAEYIWMSRVLPLIGPRALKIIDTIDVFSTRHEKVGQFGVNDLVVEPDAERMRLGRGDVLIAIQHNEREALEGLVPGVPVITSGVDFEVANESSQPSGRQVLYVASDNPMNRHGLRDFLRFAWPRVRARVPDAELVVVGAVGESLPLVPAGVTVLGRVEDLTPLYRRCRAVINPAVAGTGVKIKTLEALSHLRRVVTWPNGVDGLSPAVAGLCRTVQDWYTFSEQLSEVLTNDDAAAFSAEDRPLLAREADPDFVYAELGRVLEAYFERAVRPAPDAGR
jgi:glycosyltransferase involved in cell wall biosynthesis